MSRTVVGIFITLLWRWRHVRLEIKVAYRRHINRIKKEDGDSDINDNISDGTMYGGALGGVAGLLIGAGVVPGLGVMQLPARLQEH